jgi:ring-1,2-phenylacetyl-CoA epoxidase subunit PaaE
MQTYSLKVVDIRDEANDTVTICFKQPGLKKVKYLPGQYLTLIFRINGRRFLRPYSFSSAPLVDPHLEVTVKRIPGGIVSNHIADKVKIDDVIEVIPPLGDFIFDEEQAKGKHVVLWGAGSGVTPLFSITKYILNKQTDNVVTLVYGNRNNETTIFSDQISFLSRQFPSKFSVWHFHTKPVISQENMNVIEGRIVPSQVISVLNSAGSLANTLHYICGPVGLKASVKEELMRCRIEDNSIFTEDFEVVKNPEDFKDVSTQYVQINHTGITTSVEVVKGKSILEAALDAMIEMPYSCQTGNCSLCKGKLQQGEVKVIGLSKTRDDLAVNERLLCCSYPLTDNVQIII